MTLCFVSSSPPLLLQAREELRPVREDFEAKNKQLLDEMPKFYHSRIDYFQPSFEALIRAQVSTDPCLPNVINPPAATAQQSRGRPGPSGSSSARPVAL